MRCLVFAYHDIGCEALRTLHGLKQDILAVFTHQPDPNENRWFGSVMETAQKLKLPVHAPENLDEPWIVKIRQWKPEIIFSFYYRKLISDAILSIPPKGGLNLHGSLLPK